MKPGYQKLREDLDKVEKLFTTNKRFKGAFDMGTYGSHDGDHKPKPTELCGTKACLAGWLSIVSKHGFNASWDGDGHGGYRLYSENDHGFESQASKVYGIPREEFKALFYNGVACHNEFGVNLRGKRALKAKIAEARALADKYEAKAAVEKAQAAFDEADAKYLELKNAVEKMS